MKINFRKCIICFLYTIKSLWSFCWEAIFMIFLRTLNVTLLLPMSLFIIVFTTTGFTNPVFILLIVAPVFILLIVVISLHEKLVHPNKSHWNMIFLVSSGKMKFLFPENMILCFRRKMKYDLSQKLHGSMIFSSNVLKRWFFQNRPGI